ncbi:YoaK family protein [Paenarthrobacter sp. NPDC056912]|uniref:YoaK family protein n=1 Tax=Paenarthrobacter sp. NPDC056912 TaxID=3345965 RepID=UPI00366B9289
MRHQRLSFWLMIALSFGTGALDAATYLGMDRVFGANMTGNVILIGLSLAGSEHVPLLGPLAALGGFAVGSLLLGLILRRFPPADGRDFALVPVFCVTALGMLTVTGVLFAMPMSEVLMHTVTLGIGTLMGFQAIAARRVGVTDVSTVVVTSTLSLLFSEAGRFWGGASTPATIRRFAAVASMFLGAVCGALLLHVALWVAMLVPASILLGVAVAFTFRQRALKGVAGRTKALVSA